MGKWSVLGNWFHIGNFAFLLQRELLYRICRLYLECGIVLEILHFYLEDCFTTEMRFYWIYQWPLCATIIQYLNKIWYYSWCELLLSINFWETDSSGWCTDTSQNYNQTFIPYLDISISWSISKVRCEMESKGDKRKKKNKKQEV